MSSAGEESIRPGTGGFSARKGCGLSELGAGRASGGVGDARHGALRAPFWDPDALKDVSN